MKTKLLNLVTHPAVISFLIWFIAVIFIPPLFPEYRIRAVDEVFTQFLTDLYTDLDSDGSSEKIRVQSADPELTEILVFKEGRVAGQYNIRYNPLPGASTQFYDHDNDGIRECYLLTMNDDSIFLTVFDPLGRNGYIVSNRYIDLRGRALNGINTPTVIPVRTFGDAMAPDDGSYIFCIVTGFSKHPRNVYRYLVSRDSLLISPESGACINTCWSMDLDNDQLTEIIPDIKATGNFDFDKPYTDQYSWLMVLNHDMEFRFSPVRFLRHPSNLNAVPIKTAGKIELATYFNYMGTDTISSAFMIFDAGGRLTDSCMFRGRADGNSFILPNQHNDFATFYFIKNLRSEIEEIDRNLHTVRRISFEPLESSVPRAVIDADDDGFDEYIYFGSDLRSIKIVRSDFSGSVTIPSEDIRIISVSLVKSADTRPKLYFQYEDHGIFAEYYKNPLYYLKYPFHLVLYGFVFLFIILIFRLQRYRIKAREDMEKQMAMLQMKAIRNQLDPHFTLNVLNSIGSLYAREDNREKADYIFGKYARLIRETVISSDQIIIALGDELEFIRNYLDLERFRCSNSFSYKIDTDPGIDLQKKVPRMLIHTFVENSIKHGLKDSDGRGILSIALRNEQSRYIITIEDNNSDSGKKQGQSTGKGLAIVKELTELYFRLEKVQIRYSLEPFLSADNQIIGRVAKIEIPV